MGKRLYVGNLSSETNDGSLKQFFATLGTVEMARVMLDKGTSRGFGFVEMANEREANNAITTLNGTELDGNAVVVNEATAPGSRRNASDGPNMGYGGGGGRPRRPGGNNRR